MPDWKTPLKPIARPLRKLAGRALATLFEHQVRYPDGLVFDTPPGMNGGDFINMMLGRHEQAELSILRGHFRTASTIVEIGSNIGVVACHALRDKLEAGGTLICVEPNPEVHSVLQRNLERTLYDLRTQPDTDFKMIMAALASPRRQHDEAEFYVRNNLSSGLAAHVAKTRRDKGTISVPLVSLGEILHANKITGPYSLICDAEGAEIQMIFEDAQALRNCTQMAIELHWPKLTGSSFVPGDLLAELGDLGFTLQAQARDTYYLSRERTPC